MAFSREKNGFRRYQLDDRILDKLPKIGYRRPTSVQHKVIPLILQRRNLIVEAATGTGKTAAYGLPLITHIDTTKRSTQLLVFVPSRELAKQVEEALRSFTSDPKFRVEAVYGGSSLEEGENKLKTNPHVVVAVPGRLKDILRGGKFDHFWRDIKYLVIDEADKLLELGFMKDVDNLITHVRNSVLVSLFSATISSDVEALIRERFAPVMVVRLSPQEALRNITFHEVVVTKGRSEPALAALINQENIGQALIFCNKREEVYSLSNYLRAQGWSTEAYHGLLDQVEREAVLRRFRHGLFRFLVATDLGARGLDVEELPAVINFSFPRDVEVYLHRCGRTGRMGRRGEVFNLISSKEESVYLGAYHEEIEIDSEELSVKIPKEADKEEADPDTRWVKIHLSRGKDDKIRVTDVAGFLAKVSHADPSQIGTIAVYDNYTLADVQDAVWQTLQGSTETLKVKGKTVKITRFSLDDQKRRAQVLKNKQLGVRDKAKLKHEAEKRKKRNEEKLVDPVNPKAKARAADKLSKYFDFSEQPQVKSEANTATPGKKAKGSAVQASKGEGRVATAPKEREEKRSTKKPGEKPATKTKAGGRGFSHEEYSQEKRGARGAAKPVGRHEGKAGGKQRGKPDRRGDRPVSKDTETQERTTKGYRDVQAEKPVKHSAPGKGGKNKRSTKAETRMGITRGGATAKGGKRGGGR